MCAAQETLAEPPLADGSAIELGLPSSFAARGVSVPFTTPALGGARARLANHGEARRSRAVPGSRLAGASIELLLPNPSGKGGVYVIDWERIPQICCPTLFDRDLTKRVAALPALTPTSVLSAVYRAGAAGLAGEEVSEAAAHAAAAEQRARLLAHVALLLALIRQGEERYGVEEPGATDQGAGAALQGLERRATRVIARFVADRPLPDTTSESLGQSIEHLAVVFGGIGLGPHAADARLARLQRGVADLALDAGHAAASGSESARLVELVATAVAHAGDTLLRAARERAEDVHGLLRDWSRGADCADLGLTRAEWLFDGWGGLVAKRGRLLGDYDWWSLAAQMPAFPDEAAVWSPEIDGLSPSIRRWQGRTSPVGDWRMGVAPADLVAANESALARWILGAQRLASASGGSLAA